MSKLFSRPSYCQYAGCRNVLSSRATKYAGKWFCCQDCGTRANRPTIEAQQRTREASYAAWLLAKQ